GNDFEPYSLKQAGDLSVDDDNRYYNNIGGIKSLRAQLHQGDKFSVETQNDFIDENGSSTTLIDGAGTNIRRNKRQKRNQSISFLSLSEAEKHGLDPSLYANGPDFNKVVYKNANNGHHIGEVSVLKSTGERYVFGLPAYNTTQAEVSFATGKSGEKEQALPVNGTSGLLDYTNGDNTVENQKGLDNYFSKTTLPAYAHSYMLTSVLSPDYVDNDKFPGPTPGDMGSYTLFNYKKVPGYKWRMPFEKGKANANQGLKTIDTDDQASYIYGEKELWYLASIETKNYKAIFSTSDREDGLGVVNEDGGQDASSKRMRKLDNIKLYYKYEHDKFGDKAKPLKSVFFKYDYALCKGIPNQTDQGKGKLTLREVYFTYQDSEKGRFSPYKFNYCYKKESEPAYNPNYNAKSVDRWGKYKPMAGNDYIKMSENSYTQQDKFASTAAKSQSDINAAAWELTNIVLPSGGNINVNYEADDYAFIQDKKAAMMMKVVGFGNSEDGNFNRELYQNQGPFTFTFKKYLAIDLPFGMLQDPNFSSEDFRKLYLDGLKDNLMYFRIPVSMTQNLLGESAQYENVSGYAKIDPSQSVLSGDKTKGLIKLEFVSLTEKASRQDINPIVFAALQFCRLKTPNYAYGTTNASDGGPEQFIKAILNSSFATQITALIQGPNGNLLNKSFCQIADLEGKYGAGGFVRLNHPTQKKIGGGSRVNSISISDNASQFSMGNESSYTQEFNYSKKSDYKDKNGKDIIMSSGVAAYEPMLGGDENP
ncbi:MAG TPA: hypothetical protein VF691_15865, partial [Cytophagaceae bacterium]